MEQDQEHKHFCKLCNKSFSSGKVLGGHMRGHRTLNSTKSGKKRKKISMASEIDAQAGYSLRENPKKSWKFSAPNGENPGQENHCKVCGKGFDSSKALFGHMRHHSGKGKDVIRCKDCNKEFETLKSFSSHLKICSESGIFEGQSKSETQGLVRRKRSCRTRYKSASNPCSDLNECSSFDGIEPEVEELAICLLMLSRDVRLEEPKLNSFRKKNEIVSQEDDYGSTTDEMEKHKLEFPVGNYYAEDVESEMPKLDDESEMIMCDTESQSETRNDHAIEELNQVSAGLKSMKLFKPRKKQKIQVYELQKESSSCNNVMFPTCDSETVHKKTGNCIKLSPENSGKMIQMSFFAETDESKGHQCPICFKIFASGQALGGHKRAHVNKAETSAKLNQENSDVFDENDHDDDDGFKSWWDGNDLNDLNDLKHGQLMDLILN